ncbi:MAG: hypothetical protein JXQ65_12235 [Candidatus Marinimicrobia bacterium]|nr:hypothetical protein [Candidatus Neomarinimicrobiota bacterium]
MKRVLFLLILSSLLLAQKGPKEIVEKISDKYKTIEKMEMKVRIVADIPNLRMPEKTIRLYYKAPDSLKMAASGFALLPKNGILPFMDLGNFVGDSASFDTIVTDTLNGKEMWVFTMSKPLTGPEEHITFWVNKGSEIIEKITITNNKDILSEISFCYQNIDGFWLPDTTRFDFYMNRRIPYALAPSITNPFGSVDIGSKEDHFNNRGEVRLIFFDFRINP